MNIQQTSKKPRILILGSTGRTGKAVIGELQQRADSVQIVYSSRNRAQTYDGRMDFGAITTTVVEDLTGRKPLTLREWVMRYRDSVLTVGAQAAEGALKE